MHTIQTKFKVKQVVWEVSINQAFMRKTRISNLSVKDDGKIVEINYRVDNAYWYEEEPNELGGIFASKKEAEKFLLQGLPNFKELQMMRALERVKFQEEQLAYAKAALEEISK